MGDANSGVDQATVDQAVVEADPISPASNPVRKATINQGKFTFAQVNNGQYLVWAHGSGTFSDQQSVTLRGNAQSLAAPLLLRFGVPPTPTPTATPHAGSGPTPTRTATSRPPATHTAIP
ncbi:MAG: hypothetical protein ACR2JY_04650 [Chloroflexota bacterium]